MSAEKVVANRVARLAEVDAKIHELEVERERLADELREAREGVK